MEFLLMCIAVIGLIFLAAFFSCTETAITGVTKTDMRKLSSEKNKATFELLAKRSQIVSSALVGTNLVNNITTSIVTTFTIREFDAGATTISTIIITVLIIFFAEILPKNLAAYKPADITVKATPVLKIVNGIFLPVTFLLGLLSNGVVRFLSVFSKKNTAEITDEQLQILVDMSAEDGALTIDEQNLLTGAIRLRDLKLRNIVTPVSEIKYLTADMPLSEAVELFSETKFSRLPVCADDDTNSVLGILHYKDILFKGGEHIHVTDLMREAVFVPETAGMFRVIERMKTNRTNILIAIDEYGQNAGLATMDDIITAVFGTVTDEYDSGEEKEIIPLGANRFRIKGDAKLYDVNRELQLQTSLDINLQSEFYDTIAGLILETAEVLPNEGNVITIENIDFTIEKIEDRKIVSVRADTSKLTKTK